MNIRGGFLTRLQRQDESFKISDVSAGSVRMIAKHLKPYAGRMVLAIFFMLLATSTSLAMPYLAKVAVDDYIAQMDFAGLTLVALIYIGLTGVFWPASYWQSYLSGWVGQRVVYDMRKALFHRVLRQSLAFHRKEHVGQIMSRITNDLNAISEFVSTSLLNLANDFITVCGVVAAMLLLNVRLTFVTMLSVPVVILSMAFLAKRMRKAYMQVQQEIAAVNMGVEQGVSGMRVTQSLSRESFNIEQFELLSLRNMKANLRTAVLFAALFPTMTVTNMLSIALVLGYGGTLMANGSLTIGVMLAFFGYISRFFGPLRELSLVYNSFQAAAASLARVGEYMEIQPEISEPDETRRPKAGFKGNIALKDVTFSYDREPVLCGLDLTVDAGTTLAIVGPTGAGKSTLSLLFARLYEPQEGKIEIDGINLKDIGFADLRSLINVVPQDAYLFPGTIRENIRYGNPAAGDEAVERAARKVQAHSFIVRLPNGYENEVGEAGMLLSGGQKQLIALSRALLADPGILILDETTAHVDAHTEYLLQTGMDELLRDRTTIIIAHRFSTLKKAGCVIVMEKGQIAGVGTHEELLRSNHVYQRLYKKQWSSASTTS